MEMLVDSSGSWSLGRADVVRYNTGERERHPRTNLHRIQQVPDTIAPLRASGHTMEPRAAAAIEAENSPRGGGGLKKRSVVLTLRCVQLAHGRWNIISGANSTLSSPLSRSTSLNIVIVCAKGRGSGRRAKVVAGLRQKYLRPATLAPRCLWARQTHGTKAASIALRQLGTHVSGKILSSEQRQLNQMG